MQYSRADRFSGQPVSIVNRLGLVILAIICFPAASILFVFWGDAVGFWNQLLAAGLVVILLGLGSMAVKGAATGTIGLSWFLAPIIFAAAIWGVISVF